uniref:glutathione transferase n=1 Tax=Panagrolaimus davidi TaxID=227884 RepID=A0A914PND3_9BILA
MIFHFANVPFEDSRISQDDWPKIKPSTPTGKLPYLEVDGKQLPESGAIFRFLARKYNLVSPDDWDNAQMESAVDYFKDFLMDIRPFFMVSLGRAEGDKDQLYKNTYLPAAEKVYGRLGEILSKSTSGFLANHGVTWGDFLLSETTLTLQSLDPEFSTRFPFMSEHQKKVYEVPQLQEYLKNRKPSVV